MPLTSKVESAKRNVRFRNRFCKPKQRESICDDIEPHFSEKEVGFCVFIFFKSELFLTPKETLRMDVLMIKNFAKLAMGSIKNKIVNINSSKG